MPRRKSPEVQENISPNLIPMVDIMFLLLLFLMISADMGRRETEDLRLPEAEMAKEDSKEKEDAPITTINIFHRDSDEVDCATFASEKMCEVLDHWSIAIRGQHYTVDSVKAQLQSEADESLEDHIDTDAGKRLSKRKAVIRADQFAPYGIVLKVIETCGAAGMYKVELGAARPSPDEKA